ncbi:MAG: alpha/beta-hydrolase family protein [Actinobacteria bacterium]|nr:alpha/beta-hydrolase family protein [Actinomycetota bacterium]
MASLLDKLIRTRQTLGVPERAGLLAASTSVGQSFSRGLMPRSTTDQAVVTGVSTAINYAFTVMAQSLVEAVARRVARSGADASERTTMRRSVLLGANAAAMGAGVVGQRLLAQKKDEPILRAWGRSLSWRIGVGGLAGAIIVGADEVLDEIADQGHPWARAVPVALPLGGALAVWQYHRLHRDMLDKGVSHDAVGNSLNESQQVAAGRALLTGGLVTAGLFGAAKVEREFAGGVAALVTRVNPRAELLGRPIGHLLAFGLFTAAGYKALHVVFHRAETSGDAVEAAYASPPTSDYVSGGPRSGVSWETIGREGRRFVNMALTVDEIEEVMGGDAMPPIRAFVGLESRPTTSERADLAMQELEALGAFERSLIVFMSPTGTGYLNYVTTESLEYLTGGDVATVAIQYSLRPSPLSLDRTSIGIDQNNAFLHALKWRLSAMPESDRPRLCIFGESLGALTAEDVFADEGTEGLHRADIERGLFLGTPAATKFRQRWLSHPEQVDPDGEVIEVASFEEYLALPAEVRERARYFLLSHHNDAMPKFWFPIAVQAPTWMGRPETREPGVPKETKWRPYTTFVITLMDVKNAMHVIPGKFEANGHDYRSDLARFTSLAYDLPVDSKRLARMEVALRKRELAWAERRLVDDQIDKAKAQISAQFEKWGASDSVPLPFVSSGSQG